MTHVAAVFCLLLQLQQTEDCSASYLLYNMPSPEGAAVSSSPGLALNEWGGGGRETGGGEGKEGLEGEEEGEGTY